MPTASINGVDLFYELRGNAGEPLVLVHGSWVDHHHWDAAAEALRDRFRVLTFDRRGNGLSTRPDPPSFRIDDNVDDVAMLIERLGLAPAHIAGNSFGASIVLRLATRRPDLFRSLTAHEPPLLGLLENAPDSKPILDEVQGRVGAVLALLDRGETAVAAERFVETVAIGPGGWSQTPPELRATMVGNAATFREETRAPEAFTLDLGALSGFRPPVLLTVGGQSPPFFAQVMDRLTAALPRARRRTWEEVGHVPHWSHPAEYADMVAGFILEGRV